MNPLKEDSPVEIIEHATHAVVHPRGYLNGATGEQIDNACSELLQKGKSRIVINFEHVETINTMGIANLVAVLEKIGRRNGVICFCSLGASNRQIFDVLDISRAVLIFDTEQDALKHLADRYGIQDQQAGNSSAPTPAQSQK